MDKTDYYDDNDDNINSEDRETSDHALSLKFTFGYNSKMINGVHNLTYEKKPEIYFSSAHTGVVYNYETGKQILLQGHCNEITATCVMLDPEMKKRLIITADSGKNAMIVIWDSDDGKPIKNIFKIPNDNVIFMDITTDCRYIVTLSNKFDPKTPHIIEGQYIALWDWKLINEYIFVSDFAEKNGELYEMVRFNPNKQDNVLEFLVSGKSKIIFWFIDPGNPAQCRPYYPVTNNVREKEKDKEQKDQKKDQKKEKADKEKDKVDKKKKNKENALKKQEKPFYTQSTFLNNVSMAITGTSDGYVIVWDKCEALCKEDEIISDRRKIKKVQLLKNKKESSADKDIIKILLNYEEFIVIGSGDGAIKFYNYKFIIVRWFENVCWLVTSISFDIPNKDQDSQRQIELMEERYQDVESGNTDKFSCIPFIVTDISANIKRVRDSKSDMITYNDKSISTDIIYEGIESDIVCIAIHPNKKYFAFGVNGISTFKKEKKKDHKESLIREKAFKFRPYIRLVDFSDLKKKFKGEKVSESNKKTNNDGYKNELIVPTTMEYSNDGKFLAVGYDNGTIFIYPDENLDCEEKSKYFVKIKDDTGDDKISPIQEIIFSTDDKHFAASDRSGRLGLFKYEKLHSDTKWTIVAKYQFPTTSNNSNKDKDNHIISFCFNERGNKLYCICRDKYLYEFDISNSYEKYVFPYSKSLKVEDDCNMTSIVWYPLGKGKDKNIVIANEDYKMKMILVGTGAETLPVKQTCLGPTYGGPIRKMKVVPGNEPDKRLITFATGHKIIGLIYLPLDGNPYRVMGLIAHPNAIQDIKPAKNMEYIFTTGGNDFVINAWKYNINPLVEAVHKGGDGITPFLSLLEGGEHGVMYQEMLDFFYYAQIKSKDENVTKQRKLDGTVNSSYLPELMSAMSYYPSKKEIDNITNEVRYSKYPEVEHKHTDSVVTFEMFVKLYINHRPFSELQFDKFKASFENIRKFQQNKDELMNRDYLFDLLKTHGDPLTETDISEILEVITGNRNIKSVKEKFDAQYLFNDILGFQEVDADENNLD